MNIIEGLEQGSPAWHAHRANHRNASDAPAMMGVSPYVKRQEFLHLTYLGMKADVSAETQRIFDAGHNNEAMSRPIAEEILDESLFPVVGTLGELSASFDGITFDGSTIWECKSLNASLRDSIPAEAGVHEVELPEAYRVQMEQQLLVSGADRVLFTAAKWSDDQLVEARHAWYRSDPELRQRIVMGWNQFAADLAAYVPAQAEKPKPVGKTMASLPALFVMVEGKVTESNLEPWKAGALAAIKSVSLDMVTDEDFASAENNVKWCERGEEACDTAEAYTLSQTSSIADALKAISDVREQFRKLRLVLNPAITSRKTARKEEIIGDAVAAFHKHTADLSADLAPYRLPAIPADFAAQTARKSSFKSMQDAVDAELARAKIAANGTALRLRVNITRIADAKDVAFLFNDAADLITKDADAVDAIVSNRIRAHRDAEEKKAAALREKIAAEEKEKAEAAARAQAAEILRQEREAQATRDREAKAEADRLAKIEADAQAARDHEASEERRRQDAAALAERQQAEADLKALEVLTPSPVAESIVSSSLEVFEGVSSEPGSGGAYLVNFNRHAVSQTTAAEEPPKEEHAWINITKMNEAFGFTVTADFIVNTLGFQWTRTEKSSKFWTPTQFEAIKRKLVEHIKQATPLPF